jgi:hypothetical protein
VTEDPPWFRVTAVLPFSFEPDDGTGELPELPSGVRPITDNARVVLSRVERQETALREVARALLDAVDALEQEVHRLRTRLDLTEGGLDLVGHLITIGGDGMHVANRLDVAAGDVLRVWLELPVDGQNHLICALADVDAVADGTHLSFRAIRPELRDRIVAFAFHQQAQERRRARDRTR